MGIKNNHPSTAHADPRIFGLSRSESLWLDALLVFFTTVVSGVMSGLTIGIFSLDENSVRAQLEVGSRAEKQRAKAVMPLFARAHWVLVTLLLCNAAAAETMPLILNRMVGSFAAVSISVTLQLFFGEIIPQAVFVRFALPVAAFFSGPIRLLMFLTSPLTWPLGKLLDALVGHREAVFYRRHELREFIKLQGMRPPPPLTRDAFGEVISIEPDPADDERSSLTDMEIRLILGALDLSETNVKQAMKKTLDKVLMVDENTVITKRLVDRFFNAGYSRVPVHSGDPRNITSYILTKSLVLLMFRSETDAPKAKELAFRKPLYMLGSRPLGDLYDEFQASDCHICVVINEKNEALGIVTINDVLERIHQTNILDETDLMSKKPVQMMMKEIGERRKQARVLHHGAGLGVSNTSGAWNSSFTSATSERSFFPNLSVSLGTTPEESALLRQTTHTYGATGTTHTPLLHPGGGALQRSSSMRHTAVRPDTPLWPQ